MQYKDIKTGEIVTVAGDNSSFMILSNGSQILKSIFNKKFIPVSATDMSKLKNEIDTNMSIISEQIKHNISNMSKDVIDPTEFFNSPLSIPVKEIQEKLSNINTDVIADIPDSQRIKVNTPIDGTTTVIPDNGLTLEQKAEKLKAELKRQNYELKSQVDPNQYKQIDENDDNAIQNFVNNNKPKRSKQLDENGLTIQQEEIRQNQIQLTGVDPFKEKIEKYRQEHFQESVDQALVESQVTETSTITYEQPQIINQMNQTHQTQFEDDDTRVFRKFKRSYPITLNIKVEDKIAKPEFVKLMSEGYEADIIRFYAKDIIKNILSDIKGLEDKIYEQINDIVNGEPKKRVSKEERELLNEVTEKKKKPVPQSSQTIPERKNPKKVGRPKKTN
jgi:hypothetical protein